jgi:fructose-bisphosphate aldolase class II
MVTRDARLDNALISAIAAEVSVPLVLHGSSGVPDAEITRAVQAGITKVNVGTRLNVAQTAAVRAALTNDPNMVDARRYLGPGRDAMTQVVAEALAAVSPS